MVFGQGEQLHYNKWVAPHQCQKKEVDELLRDDNAKDDEEDNAKDDKVYDKEDDEDDDDDEDDNDNDDIDDDEDDDDEERPLTMEEKQLMGMDYVSQEEVQVSVKVACMREFHLPDECDWKSIVTTLKSRLGVSKGNLSAGFFKSVMIVLQIQRSKKGGRSQAQA
jgi:hypothetical protein